MSASVTLPNTIQIRPSRLTGLLVAVAILTGVTTWSVSQVTTESDASSNPKSEVASTPSPATQAYVDGVVALDPDQRAAIFGTLASTPQSPQSVNAALSPELRASNVDLKAIADMARAEGLTGLSPTSLRSPTQQSPQSVNAALSPGVQASYVDLEAIADMARAEGLTGLSPTSLRSPTQQSVQSVNAQSPELQAINLPPTQHYADAIADLPRDQLVAMFGIVS